jgi:hypothetical protein
MRHLTGAAEPLAVRRKVVVATDLGEARERARRVLADVHPAAVEQHVETRNVATDQLE